MKKLIYLLSFFALILFMACGGSTNKENQSEGDEPTTTDASSNDDNSDNSSSDGEPKNLADAMQQATKAIEDAGMNNQKEVINFRKLQEHLPEKLAGMERISKSGQTSGALGMNVSTAEAKYKTDDGATVETTITDTGGLGMGMMSMAAWSSANIDKEDDNGSERTSTLDGYKSFEKTRNRDKSCELSVIAEGRLIVTAKCKDCNMDLLKKTIRAMELKDLLKDKS